MCPLGKKTLWRLGETECFMKGIHHPPKRQTPEKPSGWTWIWHRPGPFTVLQGKGAEKIWERCGHLPYQGVVIYHTKGGGIRMTKLPKKNLIVWGFCIIYSVYVYLFKMVIIQRNSNRWKGKVVFSSNLLLAFWFDLSCIRAKQGDPKESVVPENEKWVGRDNNIIPNFPSLLAKSLHAL